MAKRMILMLTLVAVAVTALGMFKVQQIRTAIAQGEAWQPPPEAVTTIVAQQQSWPSSLSAIGTVSAVHGVTVSADLPGVVETIAFDSGHPVARGDVLVKLDARQEQAQLTAAEAERDLARLQLDRIRGLREKGVASQSEYDNALARHTQAEARVGEIRATIERKTIRAPFAGILGIRQADLGQYLKAGDPVVPLQSLHPIHVDFAVPQQEVDRLHVGTEVQVSFDGTSRDDASGDRASQEGRAPRASAPPIVGKITALDSIVDPATRNVKIQATFDNPKGVLRPGMFVEVEAVTGTGRPVISLPASAIRYAPYGDSVFIVEEVGDEGQPTHLGVRQQFVHLGRSRGDQIAVLSGVEPGEQVVTSGVFKLHNGAAVEVHNEVQPGNDPAPQPENS